MTKEIPKLHEYKKDKRRQQIEQMKSAASQLRELYDALLEVGFTSEQALMILGGMMGGRQ